MSRWVLLLVICTFLLPCADAASSDGEVAELRAANAALRARVGELEATVAELRQRLSEVTGEKEAAIEQVREARERHRSLLTETVVVDGSRRRATRQSELEITHGSRAMHTWRVVEAGPERVEVRLDAWASGGRYDADDTLELEVDGKPMRFPVTGYEVVRKRSGSPKRRVNQDDEFLRITVPVTAIGRLADEEVESVTGRIGSVRFRLDREQRAEVGALLEQLGE